MIHDVGGVNSIENFARSWTRAVGFHELARSPSNWAAFPSDDEEEPYDDEEAGGFEDGREESVQDAIRHAAADYGTTPGGAKLDDATIRHAGKLFVSRHGSLSSRMEAEPLLVRKESVTDEHGKTVIINVAVGQSTIYQTIFNSINTLVGRATFH